MSSHHHQYVLAIDLGTSGPKVALVTQNGELVGYETQTTPVIYIPGGGAEQNPEDWWLAIKNGISRLLNRQLVAKKDIVGLSCTTQWSGTVAVDRKGRPLMNAIIWMDLRGAKYIRKIVAGPIKIHGYDVIKLWKWIHLTGGAPGRVGKDPIAHILFIKNEHPDIYQQTYKFLEPKDYLNLKFTGEFAATYDSIALHWLTDNRDIRKVDYDQGLIHISGIERDKLPTLIHANDILGYILPPVAEELGLPAGIRVVGGTPDLQSAAIGSGAIRDFEPHLYVGTSSWLVCHVPFKRTDLIHNMCSLPSAIPNRYLLTNEQECAGACLTYLKDKIFFAQDALTYTECPPDIYQIFDEIAEKAPAGSDGLIFTPWLYGERSPIDDHFIRGGFYNQSLNTTRSHMIRAIYEGVAYNTRWLLGYVENFIRQQVRSIRIVGGGAKSNIWCQIFADVLNRTIHQVKNPLLVNAMGSAFLACVALGYLTFADIPTLVPIANTYEPNPANHRLYSGLFQEFLNIYKKIRPIYVRLNQ